MQMDLLDNPKIKQIKPRYLLLALIPAVLLLIAFISCTTIDSGSVGIRFKKWSSDASQYGGVLGTCKGWVWYNPITQKIFEYPIYVQRKTYEPFRVNAKDASEFTMDPTIAYRLDPDKATAVFTKYRKTLGEIEDGYIRTCIYEAYRTCANQYTSDYLMSHRGEFESEVRKRLEVSLSSEGFLVEEFTSQITPPQSLAEAINAKNEAVQNALKAENKVKEAEANAKIEIAKAQGIRVYTIGVGTEGMAPYPAIDMFGNITFVNQKVEIDEKTLTAISDMTGGKYFRATDKAKLKAIYDEINQLEKSKVEETEHVSYHELYLAWVLAALGLLLAEFLLANLVLKRIP